MEIPVQTETVGAQVRLQYDLLRAAKNIEKAQTHGGFASWAQSS